MQHLNAIVFLLVCLTSALGFGEGWLRLLRAPERGDALRPIQAVALGLGTLAYITLALGLLGFLGPVPLGILLAVGFLAPVAYRARGRRAPARVIPPPAALAQTERWLSLALLSFAGLLGAITLVSALAPVGGADWDSLSYHLAAPKIYLREGRISMLAYDSHTNFPFTMEMLYTLGLAFGGASGAKLIHWAAGWLTAAAVGVWTSRLVVGGRRVPAWTGPLASLAFATMPIVLWEMGTAYVDLGTALFQFLALAAAVDAARVPDHEVHGSSSDAGPEVGDKATEPGEPPQSIARTPQLSGLVLAGILSGFALGTKMTALIQFGLIGLGLLWVLARSSGINRKWALQGVLGFGVAGLLVASPWYLKSWLWVHNPVYPFFYSLFPHSFSWTREAAEAYNGEQKTFGLGKGPRELGLMLWNLAVHGRAFFINERTLLGDKIGSLGPLWIGLLPLLCWTRKLDRRVLPVLLYGLASLGVWFLLTQQTRYLAPVFAPLAVVVAVTVAALPTVPLRAGAGAFAFLAMVFSLWMHQPVAQVSLQVVTGQVTERELLSQSLQGLYEASEWVNTLPRTSRVAMYQEARGYYIDRNYFWANPLQHNMIPYDRLADGNGLAGELRRFGITHVLVNYDFCHGVEASPWYRLLMDAIRRERLRAVFASPNAVETRRGVMIYELR